MQNRRKFLKRLAAGAAFAGLGFPLLADNEKLDYNETLKTLRTRGGDDNYWAFIRKLFPLAPNRIYLNSATLGPSPYPVIDTVQQRMMTSNRVGVYHPDDSVRERLARFVNCHPAELAITHNTTHGINIIAQGVPLNAGDEVIITSQEHVGNALPWLNRARMSGITLRVFEPAPTTAETLNRINDLINKNTKVIAVPHITCTTGQVLPAKEIARLARDKGIYSFFDGAHTPGSMNLDIGKLDCDFYAGSGHKWLLGPIGTGFVYIRTENLDKLLVHHVGAYSDTGWELTPEVQRMDAYVQSAHRFEYGTRNPYLYAGLEAAIDFMEAIGMENVQNRTRTLSAYLLAKLSEMTHLTVLTPADPMSRGPIVTFKVKDTNPTDITHDTAFSQFRLRVVPEANLNAIRVSTHIFNSFDELDLLVEALATLNR